MLKDRKDMGYGMLEEKGRREDEIGKFDKKQ